MKHLSLKLTLLAFVGALAACGGGGGSDTAAVVPAPAQELAPDPAPALAPVATPTPIATPTPVVSANSNLVTTAASTYVVASEELAAFNQLNAERVSCGFGALTQSAALDTSARGHADWLLINGYTGHYQIDGTTGFTGVSPDDRVVASGYGVSGSFQSNAEAENDQNRTKAGTGAFNVMNLLNAPYHMLEMIRGYRDIGVAVRDKADVALSPNTRNVLNMNFAYKKSDGPQVAAAGAVRTYPCEGSKGVRYAMYGENPNPVPGRNLRTSPLGSSIGVAVDVGSTLVITSASMIKVSTGAFVTLRAPVMAANDPNAVNGVSYFNSNEGFVSADAPMDADTQYQVTITGTVNGTVFAPRTFTFTTGSSPV